MINKRISLENQILLFSGILIFIASFLIFGRNQSFSSTIKNIVWLKNIAKYGPFLQLYFPLGDCGNNISPSVYIDNTIPEPGSLYFSGINNLFHGDFQTAEHMFLMAIDENMDVKDSASALGVVYSLEGKDSISIWQQSDYYVRLLLLGKECVLEKSKEEASKYYKAAFHTIDPNYRKGYKQLTEYFAGTQDEESYNAALKSYVSLADPNSLEYHWTLGNASFTRKEYSDALIHYSIITKINPNDTDGWYSTGQALVFLENYDQARAALETAILLNPDNLNFYVYMGHSYLYQKKYSQAGIWYERALQIDPKSVWSMTHLIQVRVAEKRYKDALVLLDKIIKVDNSDKYYLQAADIALNTNDINLAKNYIQYIIQQNPTNIEYLKKLCEICEADNDLICLKQTYLEILNLNPEDSEIRQKLDSIIGEN